MSYCPSWKTPGVLLRDYSTPELWCLLQCERDTRRRQGDNYTDTPYLSNIEAEWKRPGVCSECFTQMGEANPPAVPTLGPAASRRGPVQTMSTR
jgi:hypothetical protein